MSWFSSFFVFTWVVFWVYWLISAISMRGSKITASGYYFRFRLLVALILIVILRNYSIKHLVNENDYRVHTLLIKIIGTIVFITGLGLAVWARVHLGRNWGTPMTERQKPELITSGPYQLVRHPIYTGIILGLLGTTLAISTIWILAVIFASLFFYFSAVKEETYLLKNFPEAYPKYISTS